MAVKKKLKTKQQTAKKTGQEKTTQPVAQTQVKPDPQEISRKVAGLLVAEPELAAKLAEALETGRFFITVTFQKKYAPEDKHDMHHYWTKKDMLTKDIVPAINHIISDFNAREDPTAELPDKKQWH